MTSTLIQAGIGEELTVIRIEGSTTICDRLFEIGFAPDEKIEIQQKLLWGGPLIVSVRGSQVALRKSEAQCIHIQTQSK